jgi:hypothetical protein
MNSRSDSKDGDLDKAGQSILHLLHKAADAVEQNNRQAVEAAQSIAQQLQASRDRGAQLERDLDAQRDRAERAEEWLNKIQSEIKEQFPQGRRGP